MKEAVFPTLVAALTIGSIFTFFPMTPTKAMAEIKSLQEYPAGTAFAYLGGGCFWCVEAVFEEVDGVLDVVSGYAGGNTENPTYASISSGETGHAEVVRVAFDPTRASYEELLDIFWQTHNPTTMNRQGADIGTQYRSIVLYADDEQKATADAGKARWNDHYDKEVVTEIVPLTKFYAAEGYHQDYFARNPNAPYCTVVIKPKLKKLEKIQGTGSPTS